MKRHFSAWLVIAAMLPMTHGRPVGQADHHQQLLPRPGGQPIDMAGLHNVIHVSDNLYSGGRPEGIAGFESLKKLGIRTILSVDGARPEVDLAKKFGMRYVHLPIGYDGVSQDQALKLAKAVQDLPGPIYLHCHHGKHRSPAAAAAALFCLDANCTAAQAADIMKRAGTDPRYTGLLTAPKGLRRPTPIELDMATFEFPETAKIAVVAEAMVELDRRWDHLQAVRRAGWKTPKNHPDIDPAHEALLLVEQFRELARQPLVERRPSDFRRWLAEGERAATELEKALRVNKEREINAEAAELAFSSVRNGCSQCHAKYRDVPQGK